MFPRLDIGPFELRSFGIALALAIVLAIAFAESRGRRAGLARWTMLSCGASVLGAGWLAARLVPMIVDPAAAFATWTVFVRGLVFSAGAWYGGFAGGLAGLLLFCRRRTLQAARLLDVIAPAIALGQSLGRIACFLAGCDHGRPAPPDLPWAVVARDSRGLVPADLLGIPLHPAQLYETAGCLALAAALIAMERAAPERRPGCLFAAYAAGYAVLRLVVENYRGDPQRGLWIHGRVSTAQLVAVAVLAAVGAFFASGRLRKGLQPRGE